MAIFSVIISEKGGTERREIFDRPEINVGRVQGNDLMLPKGNVSKRHARLLFRDGRFIVTDLKSTNGTYVNGRKIAQATLVREGDKIYVGDFVLRIEAGGGASVGSASLGLSVPEDHPLILDPSTSGSSLPPGPPPEHAGLSLPTSAGLLALAHDSAPGGFKPRDPLVGRLTPVPPSSEPSSVQGPRVAKNMDRHEVISHFPLEHDPDESVHIAVPGPPRIPSAPSPRMAVGKSLVGLASPPGVERPTAPSAGMSGTVPFSPPIIPPPRRPGPAASLPRTVPTVAPASLVEPAPRTVPAEAPLTRLPQDVAHRNAHRAALLTLLQRVGELIDLRAIADGAPPDEAMVARVERALAEAIGPMRGHADVDPDALALEARRELLELGPLTPLFNDEEVTEIQVWRHNLVVTMQGHRQVPSELGFSSEQAVARALRRLCIEAGCPLEEGERTVIRRLPRGGKLFAVLPRAEDPGHVLVLRKPQRADWTLDDLVRSGTISRAMAAFFTQVVGAQANILVTSAWNAGAAPLLGALAGAGNTDDRVVALYEDDELIFQRSPTISMQLGTTPPEIAQALQVITLVRPERLLVCSFSASVAAELVDAMGHGIAGVLAGTRAPTLRQAVLRLPADLAARRPGLTPDVASEWLASVFDVAIEVLRLRDGRHRVTRVCELSTEGGRVSLRDLFTFAVERTAAGGAVEGSFHPTGLVPRMVEDLAARGTPVDLSLFKRHSKSTESMLRTP